MDITVPVLFLLMILEVSQATSLTVTSDIQLQIRQSMLQRILMKPTVLPEGKWKHYFNGKTYTGGQWYTVDAPLDQIPVFELL